MRRIMLLALVLAAALTVPARAFDTGPHFDLTRDALGAEGFGPAAADVAAVENYFTDLYSQAAQIPQSGHGGTLARVIALATSTEEWPQRWVDTANGMHFDSTRDLGPGTEPRGLANTPGVEREWLRVMRNTSLALAEARAHQDPVELLAAIGMSLHTVQDFYAHSNWVEPSGMPGFNGPGWTARGLGSTPTWFDLPAGERDGSVIQMGSAAGVPRRHNGWNTDGNVSLANGLNKDWPGRPLWQEAAMTASFASRQWVRALRGWLGDDALWARAQAVGRTGALDHDVRGTRDISLYSGHWQGAGGPCVPTNEGGGAFSCGANVGAGGSLVSLRQAVNGFFDRGPTVYRRAFERLLDDFAGGIPPELTVAGLGLALPESSAALQAETQFVRLRVTKIEGLDLGDPGPDDADLHAQAVIAGQGFVSEVIHGHDRFTFPRPYAPFTWLRAVPVGARAERPVTSITLRVRTGDVRSAGTDDTIRATLGPGLTFTLDKRLYDDFERGDVDTYSLPIDAATRDGLTVGDLGELTIAKSRDGLAGGWRLGGVELRVNGVRVLADDHIDRWLEDDHRTWRAALPRDHRTTAALPVWLSLREDDLVYGADDVGDLHPDDRRTAQSIAYVPGAAVVRTVTGGSRHGGRLGLDNGDKARATFELTTVRPVPPPALPGAPEPPPTRPPDPPAPSEPAPGTPPGPGTPTTPTTPAPPPEPTPPPLVPDLVLTALTPATFTVRNQGDAPSGPFTVTVTGFAPVRFPAGLAASSEATRSYTGGCAGGDYHAVVDSLFEVAESSETNNTRELLGVIC